MALLQRLSGPPPVQLSRDDLLRLISAARIVREERTGIAGPIRVLELDGCVFVQEETPDHEILVRPRGDLDEASVFVDRRLQTYDRMWDG
jgi:hypothetical protein